MAERPSVKGAIAKQLDPDGLSVISNCLAIRIIAHYPIPHLLVYLAKNYLDEKELRAMGQLVSGYLDFAERQAEREQAMTMQDWAEHLDRILTMSGEQLLTGNGNVSHKQAVDKATEEYRKYKARTLSEVEQDYLDSIKMPERKTEKK